MTFANESGAPVLNDSGQVVAMVLGGFHSRHDDHRRWRRTKMHPDRFNNWLQTELLRSRGSSISSQFSAAEYVEPRSVKSNANSKGVNSSMRGCADLLTTAASHVVRLHGRVPRHQRVPIHQSTRGVAFHTDLLYDD
jgi:hypothetical protein